MKTLTFAPIVPEMAFSSFTDKLNWAKKRVDQLEQFRIQHALHNSRADFQTVFSLLPVLLHFNLPTLPCYVENAPNGIFDFRANDTQHAFLAEQGIIENIGQADFDGLYLMGSTGSITQTEQSDLDLWLCHSQRFSPEQQHAIQQKLEALKAWAALRGVEVHFYLMNPNAFKAKDYTSDTDDEHNGSAQHFFLLDEFYRSAIRLAGKRVLWLHLDCEAGQYSELVQQAVENGELNAKEWIDFGDFSSLTSDEFFGAALWQLYKGIRSPYKSAIKILLLESYTQTYPEIALISKQFKQKLLSHKAVNYHFDPYLAVLEQASRYLEQNGQSERLEFLRRCFYIKASDGQNDSARQAALHELAKQWQWTEREMTWLRQRRQWRVKQVAKQHKLIVAQLMQSYRHLINFARRLKIDPSILPQDIDFLMRQLYSAFENVPGKIELLNEKGRYDLSEPHLTFIRVNGESSAKMGWYVLNHAPFISNDFPQRYVHFAPELVSAVAWAYFNGLLTEQTQLHLFGQDVDFDKLHRFVGDLRSFFPAKSPKRCRDDLNHPNEIRNLILAINLTQDPTKEIASLSRRELEQLDLFNLNPSKQGIIGSVSIVYRNMWNEVITRHFEQEGALWKALKLISNKIYLSSAPPQSVRIESYSEKLGDELQEFVVSLVNRCITVKTGAVFQRYQPPIVQMGGKKWQLVFDKRQTLQKIVEKTPLESEEQTAIPSEVFSFASEGFLQFFFDDNADGSFNVYVLDKQNKTECYCDCRGEKEDKIRTIGRLYAESNRIQAQKEADSFNFPQFYQLLRMADKVQIVPFQSRQHRNFVNSTEQNHKENYVYRQSRID